MAGVAGLLWWPILLAMFSTLTAVLYPVFLLGVIALRGPRLHFQIEDELWLPFSRLRLWSYVKLSAMYGFLLSLLPAVIVVATTPLRNAADISVTGVPLPSQGAARLLAIVLLSPVFYALFAALAGVFSFLPFRLVTHAASLALPSREVFPNVYQYSLRTLMLFVTGCAVVCSLLATIGRLSREPPRFPKAGIRGAAQWPAHYASYHVSQDGLRGGDCLRIRHRRGYRRHRDELLPRRAGAAGHPLVAEWARRPLARRPEGCVAAASRVFAILDDGRIVPIVLTDAELKTLAAYFSEIKDPQLARKITAPFEGKAPAGTRNKGGKR